MIVCVQRFVCVPAVFFSPLLQPLDSLNALLSTQASCRHLAPVHVCSACAAPNHN